jgi:hypothetical protein
VVSKIMMRSFELSITQKSTSKGIYNIKNYKRFVPKDEPRISIIIGISLSTPAIPLIDLINV